MSIGKFKKQNYFQFTTTNGLDKVESHQYDNISL
jgi:hypothetical protein